MRVAIDGAVLGSGLGGDETFLRGVLDGLAQMAAPDDRFVLYLPSDAEAPEIASARSFSVRAVSRRSGPVHFGVSLPRLLARDRRAVDLVLTVTHAPLASPTAVALVIGDLSFEHHPGFYPLAARWRLRGLVRRQARAARVVVTPSEFSRHDVIERYGIPAHRVVVVPNRVEPAPVTAEARELGERALLAAGVDGPFVLYLGNIHARKNVDRLVAAYDRARHACPEVASTKLVIAGARWWGEDAASHDSRGGVAELGRVSEPVRRFLLHRAVALAYPSLFEGFGLPPLEAMAAGTPVLAARAAAIPEVCGDAAVLVDPLDIDAIATGLTEVVTDHLLRARLVERGRARAQSYSTARTGAAALSAFRSALGETLPRSGIEAA